MLIFKAAASLMNNCPGFGWTKKKAPVGALFFM